MIRSGMRHESLAKCGLRNARVEPEPTRGAGRGSERRPGANECGELLHGLNNALASVLLNAQVMAWKLPSYSRSKRYLHEIERNAQRGGELVKRLLERSHSGCRRAATRRHEAAARPLLVTAFDSAVPAREVRRSTQPAGRRIDAMNAQRIEFLCRTRRNVPHTMV